LGDHARHLSDEQVPLNDAVANAGKFTLGRNHVVGVGRAVCRIGCGNGVTYRRSGRK
jgi:hypothetical protein